MKRFLPILLLVLVVGCSRSSEVSEVSEGIFSVHATESSTSGTTLAAKKEAFAIANDFCRETMKKKATLLQVTREEAKYWPEASFAEIQFGCVDDGDPLLAGNERFFKVEENKNVKVDEEGVIPMDESK